MFIKRFLSIIFAIIFGSIMSITAAAEAYLLMEANTGQVLLEENGMTPLPVGTMNKLMTVLLTAEAIDRGSLSLGSQIAVSTSVNDVKGSVIWLRSGEKMSVEELLKGVIIGNAGDAGVVLAEALGGSLEGFVRMMNVRARELGMNHTWYDNPIGYDAVGQGSSAYDTALLCRELMRFDFLKSMFTCWMDTVRENKTQLVNSNTMVKQYKGILGFKAAYSEAAGWCAAVGAERNNMRYIAVVLGSGDKDTRFSRAKELLDQGFSNFVLVKPAVPEEAMTPIVVEDGIYEFVEVAAADMQEVILPKSKGQQAIEASFVKSERIVAPVLKDQAVGEMVFTMDGVEIFKTPLVAAHDVPAMTLEYAFGVMLKSAIS